MLPPVDEKGVSNPYPGPRLVLHAILGTKQIRPWQDCPGRRSEDQECGSKCRKTRARNKPTHWGVVLIITQLHVLRGEVQSDGSSLLLCVWSFQWCEEGTRFSRQSVTAHLDTYCTQRHWNPVDMRAELESACSSDTRGQSWLAAIQDPRSMKKWGANEYDY